MIVFNHPQQDPWGESLAADTSRVNLKSTAYADNYKGRNPCAYYHQKISRSKETPAADQIHEGTRRTDQGSYAPSVGLHGSVYKADAELTIRRVP